MPKAFHGGVDTVLEFDNRIIWPQSIADLFAQHNLAMDSSFNEFHIIVCRNVMIYFNRALQDRVLGLFSQSLVRRGFLALGNKESLRFSPISPHYKQVENKEKIWRKNR